MISMIIISTITTTYITTTAAAVNRHVDDSVMMFDKDDNQLQFLAHQVSVFYISVPEAMIGGDLKLFYKENEFNPSSQADAIG